MILLVEHFRLFEEAGVRQTLNDLGIVNKELAVVIYDGPHSRNLGVSHRQFCFNVLKVNHVYAPAGSVSDLVKDVREARLASAIERAPSSVCVVQH